MAKYNYDKKALKGLGVGAFLGEVKVREAKIAEASEDMPVSVFNSNILASKLHPHVQFVKVSAVKEHKDAKSFVLTADKSKGTETLAYFRAGQYISVGLMINGAMICKPYTLQSGPGDALGEDRSYCITVKHSNGGFASEYILENWKEGTELAISGPLGDFYYQGLRDAKSVVALAGGSGITPFYSMASAIADGIEDFDLTILYGSRTADNILLGDELAGVAARSNGRVKVVNVLSDEEKEGYEHGLLTAELVKKYAPSGDYSLFVCGPKAMYPFIKGEVAKLGLSPRRARFELSGEFGDPSKDPKYPKEAAGKEFSVKVLIRGEEKTVKCRSEQSLLQAMEAGGISVPSDCRSGKCGWCHSRLISGEVFIPEDNDGRREADKKFGWVHPCSTYALSDIEIEIFPIM